MYSPHLYVIPYADEQFKKKEGCQIRDILKICISVKSIITVSFGNRTASLHDFFKHDTKCIGLCTVKIFDTKLVCDLLQVILINAGYALIK